MPEVSTPVTLYSPQGDEVLVMNEWVQTYINVYGYSRTAPAPAPAPEVVKPVKG